ncbi:uncharacterized protein YgiM (DUF1202 family) [Pedobacter sp. UYP30]|uniref:SH3 domain-containing protein n=1 Tax=Pedobacter sp. UYP30 TaxID=1756400 RepID=UPI0033969B91
MALPIISFATDYYIARTGLNVRASIGTRYSVSFTLQKGDEVELVSKEKSWYKIKYLGKTGYANSKYLKFSRNISHTKSNTNSSRSKKDKLLILACAISVAYIGFTIYGRLRDKKLLESVTNKNRGTESERDLVLKLLKFGIPKENIFHNLYVEKRKTQFS